MAATKVVVPSPWIETRVVRRNENVVRGFVEYENPETTESAVFHWFDGETVEDARAYAARSLGRDMEDASVGARVA